MKNIWILMGIVALSLGCSGTQRGAVAPTEPATPVETPAESTSDAATPSGATPEALDDALRQAQEQADLMLFESWPLETTLGNDHIADVLPVWLDAVKNAQESIDLCEYYANNRPGTGLDRIVTEIEKAAKRGVKVRLIVDKQLNKDDNAELPKAWSGLENFEVREIAYSKVTGGIQHAKYFIIDGKTAYFGSQNLDWRSLEHISEMGARLRPAALVAPLKQLFEIDWNLAENPDWTVEPTACPEPVSIDYKGEMTQVALVASPKQTLPCASMWDLPRMIAAIQAAKTSISVQLLNYATLNYDKTIFMDLDDALTQAAARGVHVRLLVSDWSTKPKHMKDMKRLAALDNFEVRMIEVPEHSSGFVPYSRTIHSKFMVVDDAVTWLGTSNWAGDYFNKSRNVGILATGRTLNGELTQSFDRYWTSSYAIQVDPLTDYAVKDQTKPKAEP